MTLEAMSLSLLTLLLGGTALMMGWLVARALQLRGRHCAVFIAIFVAAAGAFYAVTGSPLVVPAQAARETELAALGAEASALQVRLEEDPKDAKNWAALGRARMLMGDYAESAEAYKKAVLLTKGAPLLILQYAKALVFAAEGVVSPEARRGFEMVRKLEPENPEARYFLALAELQAGNAEKAMREMKALYQDLPEDSPLKRVINRQIGRE